MIASVHLADVVDDVEQLAEALYLRDLEAFGTPTIPPWSTTPDQVRTRYRTLATNRLCAR